MIFFAFLASSDFRDNQKKFPRVKNAYAEKEESIKKLFSEKNVNYASFDLYIQAFKKEGKLHVYARDNNSDKYKLLKEYDFCYLSGSLGPKRKQGDLQVPEGFYYIDRFNPSSNFHLSLGINYPNKSDKILGNKNPGGDIFIHGDCVSIGCIPITDDKIKELYVMAVEAKAKGQEKIPVHIFPFIMNGDGWRIGAEKSLLPFWESLQPAYTQFISTKKLPVVSIDNLGNYRIE
jgi:murein L,D-transpeptidase YafK